MRTKAVFPLVIALSLCFTLATWAQDKKADPAAPPDHVPGEVLVKFGPKAPPAAILNAAQAVGAQHVRSFDQLRIRHWRLGGGLTVEKALEILAKRPFVEFAEPNYLVLAHQAPNDPLLRSDVWGMHNSGQTGGTRDADIDALQAWGIRNDASTIVVADIDTGLDYTHEDLAANVWINPGEDLNNNGLVDASDFNGIDDDNNGFVDDIRGWDFSNDDNDPFDDNGHGTHTSGTIGAVGDNGKGVVGVCWKVKIMPLKFLNRRASGSTADAIAAVLYAASFNVPITSNSWGGGRRSKALQNAIQDSGALFVASAGNSGSDKVSYPAGYSLDNILSVAATDDDDQLASFSNFSTSWVDLGAPGVDVLSCLPGNTYAAFSGTSMSAPHCAGAAALVLARSPGLSSAQLKQTLMNSVDHIPSLVGKTVTGGRLNVFRALGGSPADPPPEPVTDTTPPATVSDLLAGGATTDSVTLSFTASADDAYAYDVRFLADQPVTASNWDSAVQVFGESVPGTPGPASITVPGLRADTTYYFALKVADEEGNISGISNSPEATTLPLPPGSWVIETVDSFGLVGVYASIALDAAGDPHISYRDESNRGAKYARWTGSAWSIEAIPNPLSTNTGFDTSLALDAIGNAHVTYRDILNGNLRYAKLSGSVWSIETADAGGRGSSLALDANGFPHVAHNGTGLKYVRWNGSQWITETVDSNGGGGSLALHGSNPCISYVGTSTSGKGKKKTKTIKKLMLARWTGTAWQLEIVDDNGNVGSTNCLALDGSGNPHISYHDAANGDLKYARWNGSAWQIQAVDTVGSVGDYSSLALDAAGNAHISYHDATNGALKYARWTGSAWNIETVDSDRKAGWQTSLALDSLGNPHIAYVESPNDLSDYDLRYA
ncbi:MAG: S8 family serine peptidase, partial [Planctomycetota bacterium]|nr:S8 family serine peptidase [Planctomycetota bacterium]